MRAARAYLGRPAVYHQDFAGNCFEQPTERCLQAGLGPDQFDCSGLVIRATCDVLGIDVTDWPADMRHIREMWGIANGDQLGMTTTELARGALLTIAHRYNLTEQLHFRNVAAHAGFITNTRCGIRYIHASPFSGIVKEGPVMSPDSILGAMTLDESWTFVGASLVE